MLSLVLHEEGRPVVAGGHAALPRLTRPPYDRVPGQVVVEDLVERIKATELQLARGGEGLVQRRFGVGRGLAFSAALTG